LRVSGRRPPRTKNSQPGIDGLALQGEDAEDALVHAPEWFALHETFEPFHPQSELSQSQRTLPGKPTFAKTLQMLGQRVLRPIDDPEVLATAALHRWL
jgi:hypothetical protein